MISIVIPTVKNPVTLTQTREALYEVACPLEVIIVAPEYLRGMVSTWYPHEKLIFSGERGRGNFLYQGSCYARGEVILFLHDDTLLPPEWYTAIREVLKNKHIVGGAFSLKFNVDKWQLKALVSLSDLFYRITGELWGDRGIFIRADLLKEREQLLRVPIMEDVRLAHYMRKNGATVLLDQAVVTDAGTFLHRGVWKHVLIILFCRFLYALRVAPRNIFRWYYR